MSFDRAAIAAAIARLGPVTRVLVAESRGSAPREAGAAMLVGATGQEGTIGGGALEWQAAAQARALTGAPRIERLPLGPALGQCCGGAVTLVFERFDATTLAGMPAEDGLVARPLDGSPMPLAIRRTLARARDQGQRPVQPVLSHGWLVEAESAPTRPVWIWGAGHVGRALAAVLAPLPGLGLTWIDSGHDRFPAGIPANVTALTATNPADLVPLAPPGAEHLILTYSHALDLELCHRLLAHGFARCGLIGSATKWARFRSRLAALGHADAQILRIACPIGDPALGKHPQAIAVGVAAALLRFSGQSSAGHQTRAGGDR